MCESDLVEGSTGIVTFLFTDVEGSTRGWQDQPEAMALGVAAHDDLMRASIEGAGGRVFALGGDSFAAAFETADAAVGAAVSAQRALGRQDWPTSEPIRVRMGVHTGPAEQRADNFFGPTVNRAARLMSAGHGGQILVSEVSASLLEFDHGLLRLGERRLADVDGVDVVYQVGAERFPPLRAVRVFECDVPVARTELIGRDDELAAIDRALRESRLVTLVGAGGTGKTRLAFEAARAARARFEAGVRLVDLTVVGEADEVAPAVAAAVDAMIGIDGWAAAIGAIGNRNTLLVFDNCEHLIEEVADGVDELLSSCQNLTVLATSREPLEIGGEAVRPVPPLDPAGSAIDLFCVRVRAAGVDPDQFDPADVAELCARLDGLPLALELAAGRARTLSPTELIERLDQGGDLETGRRRRRRRHDTLEDTIAWSYDLLDDDERTVLRRCSIFEGEFVLRGIETTAGLSQGRTVAALEGLVAKSLVIRVHGASPADASRYRLLETIRDFATRRLGDDNGRTVALDGLVDYLIGLYDAWLAGESRPRLLDELGLQRTTIATAARHADATGRLDALGDVLQLWMLIWMTGSFATEPLDAISVDRVDELPGEVRGQLIVQSGIRCLNRGDVEGCQRDIAQTLALSAGRDTAHGAVALSIQSRLVAYIDPDAAREIADRAWQMKIDAEPATRAPLISGDDTWMWQMQDYASVLLAAGDTEDAWMMLLDALRLGANVNPIAYVHVLIDVVWTAVLLDRPADGLAALTATEDADRDPWRGSPALALVSVAHAAAIAAAGDATEAQRMLLSTIESWAHDSADGLKWSACLVALGVVAFHAGDTERALRLLEPVPSAEMSVVMLRRAYLAQLGRHPTSSAPFDSPDALDVDPDRVREMVESETRFLRRTLTEA